MDQDIEYVSEFTKFMTEFLDRNPEQKTQQVKNRSTWWDRELDREIYDGFDKAKIKQKSYVYQPD